MNNINKYKINYYFGLWEQKFETPFASLELERDENESYKDFIARGLSYIGAYPKSYHAKIEEIV